jgi:hypothetical protein
MALATGHKKTFDTLVKAIKAGDVALLECQMAATGETSAVICAAVEVSSGNVQFFPFAMLFNDNPYKLVNPPKPDGGFYSQAEICQ